MASIKSLNPSQKTSNQNGLQKMYIFNEPAFRKVRHEIDNEKYLSDLDKELKQVLYDRKTPKYRKWLQYKEILTQYFNFRNFMNESQTNEDEMSTRQLNLEQRIQELENQLKANENIQPQSSTELENQLVTNEVDNASMEIDAKNVTPNAGINLNESVVGTNKGMKRKSTTPQQSSPRTEPRKKLNFGQNDSEINDESFVELDNIGYIAPAGLEEFYGTLSDESSEKSPTKAMNVNYDLRDNPRLNDTAELMRVFDNELIGKLTIKQRLDAAPEGVRKQFLINNMYPMRLFNITYYDSENQQDREMTINGLNVSIIKGDMLRINNQTTVTRVDNIKEDSLNKIRLFLVDFHTKIDDAVEDYKLKRGDYISTKKYSIRDDENDKNMKIIRYKNAVARVPAEILEDVINMINSITPDIGTQPRKNGNAEAEKKFKEEVAKMKKIYQRTLNTTNVNQSFATPTQSSSKMQRHLSAAATARRTSTPAMQKKRKAHNLTYGETTINSFDQPNAKVRAFSPVEKMDVQEGNGFRTRFKWKKI